MQNIKESLDIVINFHKALARLKEEKKIRGIQTFTNKYNIDKRTLYRTAKHPSDGAFEIGWLLFLVRDYNVNPEWLITGKGDFYKMVNFTKSCAKFVHKDVIFP